ncbi:MAG: hypothetical protein MUO26_12135 [Methanotrichaceae archaeon]|nr:hypothetical protein [Methanotrichaceae archaeon]
MIRTDIIMIALSLLCAIASTGDWLEGGYVDSSNYREIRQYFTDSIFYTKIPVSQPISMHNIYDTTPIFRDPLYLGLYTPRYPQNIFRSTPIIGYPNFAWQSDFRNQSLAAMHWDSFKKNWTSTMNVARSKSSFRVLEDGFWKTL